MTHYDYCVVLLTQSACRIAYLLGSVIVVFLLLAQDVATPIAAVSYSALGGCVAVGVWMKYTIIRTLRRRVRWGWWAWLFAILLAAAIDLLTS